MKPLLFILTAACFAMPARHAEYIKLIQTYPAIGNVGSSAEGEIELLLTEEEIAEAEKSDGRRAGVVAEDRFFIWINDPVRFPNGKKGIYGRVAWKSSFNGASGACALPLFEDSTFGLIAQFRHASRTWELELPKGVIDDGENAGFAALRELKEETGCVAHDTTFLGEMSQNPGMAPSRVAIYLTRIDHIGDRALEDGEAIAGLHRFTLKDLEKAILDGAVELNVHGKKRKVHVRDPAITYALFQAAMRSLLP